MKYYLIDGQYKSWDYLHNSLGYTTGATESVSYNSVINWGSGAGNGYCTDTDDVEAEYFVSGVVGWYNINQLALTVHLYPSDVEDFTVEKNGVVSNAVRMNLDDTEYWLIEEEVKGENPYGWMARSVAEQEGWHEYEDVTYEFIFVDSTTGRITYGVETLTEIEFTPTGYFTIDEGSEVIFVEQSPFPVVCIDEGTRTPESVAPDDSFDTELPYYDTKLYIVTTDDGQDETMYGWQAEEGTPVVAPSVGDIITLGKYPQNTSNTPEDIEWIVLAVDASNHKALLISKYILDACKYTQFGTSSTTWKESRARDWLNSTFYDSAFNIFEKRVVIQSNITTPDNPTYGTSGGDPTQDRLFFLSAQEASSLFADDNARKTTATWKARADGTWSDNNYAVWLTRTPGHTNAFVVNVSHEGSVYEVGDDINSTWTGARPSLWFDYAEPIPEPLPAVTLDAGWCTTPSNHVDFPASTTQQARYWQNAGWQSFPYDSTKAYAVWWWNSDSSGSGYFGIVLSDNGDGYFGITNVLSYTISRFVEARYATCESPDAVAIQVLNSSNVAYAAFKYTRGGIDYYYVLDEIQTDWTDDLSSIGYSLTPAPLNGYFDSGGSSGSGIVYQGGYVDVYDASGNLANYESGKTYTCLGVYHTGGEISGMASRALFGQSSGKLRFSLDGVTYIQNIFRIEYTVS